MDNNGTISAGEFLKLLAEEFPAHTVSLASMKQGSREYPQCVYFFIEVGGQLLSEERVAQMALGVLYPSVYCSYALPAVIWECGLSLSTRNTLRLWFSSCITPKYDRTFRSSNYIYDAVPNYSRHPEGHLYWNPPVSRARKMINMMDDKELLATFKLIRDPYKVGLWPLGWKELHGSGVTMETWYYMVDNEVYKRRLT